MAATASGAQQEQAEGNRLRRHARHLVYLERAKQQNFPQSAAHEREPDYQRHCRRRTDVGDGRSEMDGCLGVAGAGSEDSLGYHPGASS